MKITVMCVGKLKETYLKQGCLEYQKRIKGYSSLEIIEVPDEKIDEHTNRAAAEKVRRAEAEKIQKRLRKGSFLIALDIQGESLTSEGLAQKIENWAMDGNSDITFLIGGSLGLYHDLIKNSNYRLSMSQLTFPHQLARLLLLEQIYRAFKINRGEPYAK